MKANPKTIFSPQQVSVQATALVEERSRTTDRGIKTGISAVDKILNPHRPGELRVVLGYTSNYKSGLMNYIARHNARLLAEGSNPNRVIITVTWEQSVEEQGVTDLAQLAPIDITRMMRGEMRDDDWRKLRAAAVQRGALPWWLIGHSSEGKVRRPRMSLTDVANALAYLVDEQCVSPALICLDYLQRIRREGESDARLQYSDMVDRCKDMALAFGVPVMLGSQASRRIKQQSSPWRLPQPDDGQETSNLEQSADSLLSLWMPKQDFPVNHKIEYGDLHLTVTPNLLVLGIMKQKFGVAPKILPLHVRPEVNEIAGLEGRMG